MGRSRSKLYWALALVACGSQAPPTAPPPAMRPARPSSTPVFGDAGTAPAVPVAATARYGAGEIETACNGRDDDGDGITDLLLPVAPNRCETHLPGACGHGFAACEDGKVVCLAPPPMPEVANGIDDDCNGVVDDVASRKTRARVLVAAPRYAWKDAGPDLATVTATLAQGGIPYDEQAAGTDWREALHGLENYAAVVVPGYLIGEVVAPDIKAMLEAFAERGGVVVVWKPIGKDDERAAWQLAGLRSATRHHDVEELRFTGTAPITAAIDSPEERRLPINAHAAPDGVEVWVLDPDPAANTETIAEAYVNGAPAGAAITRRRIGRGSIYALGHDLSTYDAARCYVNCFEPSGDVLRLVLEGALREGAGGHVVLAHTAPSEASSVLVLTHDIDAPDSQGSGDWGEPGALQAARVEHARGYRATFNITTDYIAGYFNPSVLAELCGLGMCPLGAHSVQHGTNFGTLPYGTCAEDRKTYGKTPTLCGEIHVSSELVRRAIGTAPRAWRAPYLAINPRLFEALAHEHFAFDSGFGVGDLPWNLPVDLASVGFHQDRFHHVPLLELPISCEDGIDELVQGKHQRIELQASNHAKFVALWRYILVQNARNRSFTMLLMHPSRGRDQPDDNVGVKIRALTQFLDDAALEDVTVRSFEDIGDFWRARLATKLDGSYDAGTYTGTITADKVAAPAGFTLEFGDAIKTFTCEHCGATRIHGNRVVIVGALPPHTTAAFVARTR